MVFMRKIFITILTVLLCVFHIQPVFAEDDASGECGDNVSWTLVNNTLTISGTGEMYDYSEMTTPWYADKYRLNIKKVVIKEGVTSIGDYAFFNCQDIAGITIAKSVQSIGVFAFYCARDVETVELPDGLKRIEEWLFAGCSNLQHVTIPDSVEYIGEYAFSNNNLKELALPSNLRYIGFRAFSENDSLLEVNIPDSVTHIGSSAFECCSSLYKANLPKGITKVPSRLFSDTVLTEIEIPDGVIELDSSAFEGCGELTKVIIPDSVTKIGDYAFSRCAKLTDLRISEDLEDIGKGAFYGCLGLAEEGFVVIGGILFQYTGDLTSVVIPDNVKRISSYAFDDSAAISVTVGSSVVKIDDYGFIDSNVSSIQFSEGLEYIGINAFEYLPLTEVIMPSSLKYVGNYAFSNCTDLEFVGGNDQIEEIGDAVFRGCEKLAENGLVIVWNTVFDYFGEEETVSIPDGVKEISTLSFYRKKVTEVLLPDTLESIRHYAFYDAYLEYLNVPGSVKTIGNYAFEYNPLKEVTLQEGVESIGALAFERCTAMEKLSLPKSLKSIGNYAFTNCIRLGYVLLQSEDVSIGTKAIGYAGDVTINANRVYGFMVLGESGSTVETYCRQNGQVFIPYDGEYPLPDYVPDYSPGKKLAFNTGAYNKNQYALLSKDTETALLPVDRIVDYNGRTVESISMENVQVRSTDPSVADVDENKTSIIAKGAGNAFIEYTAEYNGQTIGILYFVAVRDHIHSYKLSYWDWADDYSSASAVFVCADDPSHIMEIPGVVTCEREEPTCTEEGWVYYTATVTYGTTTYKSKITRVLPPADHVIDNPVYRWAADNSSVTASGECTFCGELIEETVKTTYSVIKEPACEEKGTGRYTAEFNKEQFETQTKDVDIDAVGHKYELTEWQWSADFSSASALFVCSKDSSHTVTLPAEITSATTEPTCSKEGKIEYTAAVTFEDRTYTDTKIQPIDMIPHTFGTPVYTWLSNYGSATAAAKCNECDHIVKETVSTTYTIIKEPTQEEYGIGLYKAEFTNELFETQTIEVRIAKKIKLSLNIKEAEIATQSNLQLTVTVEPSDAENKKVIWTSSDETIATVNQNGKVNALRYGKVTITATAASDSNVYDTCEIQTRFYDVNDPKKYYYNPVYWAADNEITTGYDKVYFGPEKNCTRQELAIFLWRLAGKPAVSGTLPFTDTNYSETSASFQAILWCSQQGIVRGYSDGSFKPKANVTRKDTMIMLYRLAKKPEVTGEIKFPDVLKENYDPDSDTYKAILWGVQNGITNGYSDGNFQPKTKCLREHIVTFIYRADKVINY